MKNIDNPKALQAVSPVLRWACWAGLPVFLLAPLAWMGVYHPVLVFGSSDPLFYLNALELASDSLRRGILFPRWFADANAGFGSPFPAFYMPLAYWLTVLVNLPLRLLDLTPEMQLVMGMYASQVVSGWTAWFWLRRRFALPAAFLGSVLFVLLPYKLVYIYLHLNLAQLWALAFLPLWMAAAEDVLEEGVRPVAAYALALAAVYYSHALTVLAFGTIPAAYVLWFGYARGRFGSYARLMLAHVLALGLCAMQALPQATLLARVNPHAFLSEKFLWRGNLFHIDTMLCAYYGCIALLVAWAVRRLPELRTTALWREAVFWIAVLGVTAFLTEPPSAVVWEYVPLLPYLQFPAARLHAGALMAAVFLMCFWLQQYRTMLPLGPIAYRPLTLGLLIAAFSFATLWHLHSVFSTDRNANGDYLGDARRAYIIPAREYQTEWHCIPAGDALALYRTKRIPPPATVEKGQANVAVQEWNPPERIRLALVASSSAIIVVRQCYFPGWRAWDEAGNEIPLFPDSHFGETAFTARPGIHTIMLTFDFAQETVARWLSLGSLAICLTLIAVRQKIRAPRRRPHQVN